MRLTLDAGPAGIVAEHTDTGERFIVGTLAPYGRPGSTSAGRVTIRAGAIEVPDDLASVKLTCEHDRTSPIAYLADVTDHPDRLTGRFKVGSSTLAAQSYVEAAERVRDGLSVELDEVTIERGEVTAGRLVSVALVAVPAFDTARAVAAADTPDPRPLHTPTDDPDPDPAPDPKPSRRKRKESAVTEPTEVAEATEREPELVTAARVPAGLRAARTEPRSTGDTIEAAMAAVASAMQRPGDAELMAALSDVTYTGAAGAAPPQWLGKLWQGDRAERPFIDSISRGRLTNGKAIAWDWGTKPAGGPYSGDKAAIPSNTPTVQTYTVDAARWAGGHDLDRALLDFNMTEYLTGYTEAMVDDYRRDTEAAAVAYAKSAAVANTTAATTAAGLVESAVAIAAVGGRADVVFIAADLVSALAATAPDKLPGIFANFTLADWLDRIHPALDPGTMLVQDRRAITFHELADPPVRVDALQLALGGFDRAFFGYYALTDANPGAVQLVTPVAP